jgi:pimeloyl-CoA synthetase
MKIAEALVLRKHLEAKVKQLEPLKLNGENGAFEFRTERVNINENVDEVKMQIPKLELKDVTAEYDKYSKALRELDVSIQQANWAADVTYKPAADIKV